ncbi:terminase [Mycolicibacterium sp. XJ2546]
MTECQQPSGLGDAGTTLWGAVTDVLDLDEHNALALRELCRTADTLDRLQAIVDRDGDLATSSQGMRAHPALVELRQQRIVFARLMSAMQLPSGLTASQHGGAQPAQPTQRRPGAKGVYAINGGRA